MENGRRLRRSVLSTLTVAAIASAGACFSFGDLSGGDGPDASDASAQEVTIDAATPFEADIVDSGSTLYPSCKATHAALPSLPNGFYSLLSDNGGAPFTAYCDMTNDDGGWMLV